MGTMASVCSPCRYSFLLVDRKGFEDDGENNRAEKQAEEAEIIQTPKTRKQQGEQRKSCLYPG